MLRSNPVSSLSGRTVRRRRGVRPVGLLLATALLGLAGCGQEVIDEPAPSTQRDSAVPSPTDGPATTPETAQPLTTEQACDVLKEDEGESLSIVLSFMDAEQADMAHLLAAEGVADEFGALGERTEEPLGRHLQEMASEVRALIAVRWEAGAGEDWAATDQVFDRSAFDVAGGGIAKECDTR